MTESYPADHEPLSDAEMDQFVDEIDENETIRRAVAQSAFTKLDRIGKLLETGDSVEDSRDATSSDAYPRAMGQTDTDSEQ